MIISRKRVLLIVAMIVFAGAVARGEPSGKCGGGAFAASPSGASICSTSGPYRGSLEARSTGGANGYVVLDGDSTNESLPSNALDGYAGFQTGGGYQGPVFGSDGDYVYGPQPPPGLPTPPPGPPSPIAACCEGVDTVLDVHHCESTETIHQCLAEGRRLCAPSSCLPDGTCSVGTVTTCVPPTCCQIGSTCAQEDAATCLLQGGSVVQDSVCDLESGSCASL